MLVRIGPRLSVEVHDPLRRVITPARKCVIAGRTVLQTVRRTRTVCKTVLPYFFRAGEIPKPKTMSVAAVEHRTVAVRKMYS
jgi:hypothetical protein